MQEKLAVFRADRNGKLPAQTFSRISSLWTRLREIIENVLVERGFAVSCHGKAEKITKTGNLVLSLCSALLLNSNSEHLAA